VIELGDGVFPLLAGSKADSSIIILNQAKKIAADQPAYYLSDLAKSAQEKSENKKASHLDKLLHLNRAYRR
jgi:hypothetical protein